MSESEIYSPRRPSSSRVIELRGLACHLRSWGDPASPLVVLLHGMQDASATFQFFVDEFRSDRYFVAPDWRGHGGSGWAPQGYWFQDYLADLDALLDHLAPGQPVMLVGHSLGGNVANAYAGVRPERVTRLASLDGFGLSERDPDETPQYLRKWLDAWRAGPEPSRAYPNVAAVAERLRQAHPRLPVDKSLFLAQHTTRRLETGEWEFAFDPLHRLPFPVPYRRAEWLAVLRRIEAPTLWLASDRPSRFASEPGGLEARLAAVKNLSYDLIAGTSHNLHHDEPADVARRVEEFLLQP